MKKYNKLNEKAKKKKKTSSRAIVRRENIEKKMGNKTPHLMAAFSTDNTRIFPRGFGERKRKKRLRPTKKLLIAQFVRRGRRNGKQRRRRFGHAVGHRAVYILFATRIASWPLHASAPLPTGKKRASYKRGELFDRWQSFFSWAIWRLVMRKPSASWHGDMQASGHLHCSGCDIALICIH